jgi:cellulose synthase/poly-beta-1,6-N-acetylglucosamine synthase-like glycosyltransferase
LEQRRGTKAAVSFVVPVRNGSGLIRDTLVSILAQADSRPLEVIVVDDGSEDESVRIVEELAGTAPIRVIRRLGEGAAGAINAGILAARHPIVCQVDQDVRLERGWLQTLTAALDDPSVGAAQGYFTTDPHASLFARVMSLDLEDRYCSIRGDTDHVCTGNSVYSVTALRRVGLFDEALGYGYDNDMSYRLRAAGYRLAFCPGARSVHTWRDGFAGYLRQQYGFGYGRVELVMKHPRRVTGDRVSPAMMMLHPIAMLIAMVLLTSSAVTALSGDSPRLLVMASAGIIGALVAERLWAGWRAAKTFHDGAALLFPVFHLARDVAWVAAMLVWTMRRIAGSQPRPADSMQPRQPPAPSQRSRSNPVPDPPV